MSVIWYQVYWVLDFTVSLVLYAIVPAFAPPTSSNAVTVLVFV